MAEVRAPLSVLLTVKNEEAMLPGALASVRGLAEETVVVVDAASTDGSADLARDFGAKVFTNPFVSSSQQVNFGLSRCSQKWVLVLDADERVSEQLRQAICRELHWPRYPAYGFRRRNWALGKRVRFGDWGWDWVVRLLNRDVVRFTERAVHGVPETPAVGKLSGYLDHFTFRSWQQYLPKLVDYAQRGAQQAQAKGKRCPLWLAVARAEWRFFRSLFLRLGILDGGVGLVLAILAAYGTFLKWAMVWSGLDEANSSNVL